MEISRIGQLQHYARTFDSGVRSLLSGCSDVQFVSTFFFWPVSDISLCSLDIFFLLPLSCCRCRWVPPASLLQQTKNWMFHGFFPFFFFCRLMRERYKSELAVSVKVDKAACAGEREREKDFSGWLSRFSKFQKKKKKKLLYIYMQSIYVCRDEGVVWNSHTLSPWQTGSSEKIPRVLYSFTVRTWRGTVRPDSQLYSSLSLASSSSSSHWE